MGQNEQYITVGKLGKTRGIGGGLYVTPFTDFPDRFLELTEILVRDRDTWETKRIEKAWLVSGRPVLKFAGVNSREEAARLTNRELAVRRDQTVPLPDGSFYVFDLIGCSVYAPTGDEPIGEIVDVYQYPANDAYLVALKDGRQAMLAAIERYVKMIDVEAKKIVIDPTGLVDLPVRRPSDEV